MTLYDQWLNMTENQQNAMQGAAFYQNYIETETRIYKELLSNHEEVRKGTLEQLAEEFDTDNVTFTGFISGIEESIQSEIDAKEVDEETEVTLDIDYEKLLYNMMTARAKWLYNLEEWKLVFSSEEQRDIRWKFNDQNNAKSEKVGRNEPCLCGSGKKYKKCCGK